MLEIEKLTVKFGGLVAVSNLDMTVREGEIHSLIGPNGAGKTTVMNCISGFQRFKGKIYFEGRELSPLPSYERARIGIARTFQNLELFGSMTVKENLLLGLHPSFRHNIMKDIFTLPKEAIPETAIKVARLVGIEKIMESYVAFLPYGIKKIVEIGRALVSNPKLIMLDEPAAGLNFDEKEHLKGVIRRIKESGITVLLIEHDMSLIMDISDSVTVMNFGKKIAEGSPKEISRDPLVIDAYLGENEDAIA